MFLVLFCFISVDISEIQLVCDRPTDRPTDGRTDGRTDRRTDRRTDIPFYRDARTHLKIFSSIFFLVHDSPFGLQDFLRDTLICITLLFKCTKLQVGTYAPILMGPPPLDPVFTPLSYPFASSCILKK